MSLFRGRKSVLAGEERPNLLQAGKFFIDTSNNAVYFHAFFPPA
jgi:hypothetical protein